MDSICNAEEDLLYKMKSEQDISQEIKTGEEYGGVSIKSEIEPLQTSLEPWVVDTEENAVKYLENNKVKSENKTITEKLSHIHEICKTEIQEEGYIVSLLDYREQDNDTFAQKESMSSSSFHKCVDKKNPTCSFCNKTFIKKCDVAKHIRCIHNEKPFICKFCAMTFFYKSDLNSHLHCHRNEKPYVCILCSKAFRHKSGLITHSWTHTNEKPFKCQFCEKSFSQKSGLTAHARTHTFEKPFTCNFCKNSFYSKSVLVIHIRTHTN
ncbi:hypothetical protein L9F63_016504 [Diploptera punctata]|uniref:C2H2-type domain-containing protein n=1 Tax=Diploptera punctata TaxID=6984 RepID=A0AAD8EHH3_DIPPU|nr:hypothetical protein L9F63_016504 [Diploptera punctata]